MLLVEEAACASEAATDPKTREPLTSLQRPHHQMPAHSKTHPCPPNTVHSLQSHTEIFAASSLRVTEPHLVLHPNPSRALLWHKHLTLKQTCAGSPMLMLSPPPPVTRLSLAAVAAPTPGAGCQLLSPSTPPHRAALLSRFGQEGLSLSLHMHSPHMCTTGSSSLLLLSFHFLNLCLSSPAAPNPN